MSTTATTKTKKTKKTSSVSPKNETPKSLLSQQQIEEKLITARIRLLIREPFFGSMATHLNIIRDDETFNTAATDGRNFFYNLEFINGLTIQETEFLFAHEVLHNVFEHHFRKEHRNHLLWNIACDYAVNAILIESDIGDALDDILFEEKYKNKCAEEIYDDLYKNVDKLDLQCLSDKLLDEHLDKLEDKGKSLSEEEKNKIRSEIRESLLNSFQTAAGDVPDSIKRLVRELTEPKMNWKELLRQSIQSSIKNDFSFYRPSKKGRSDGFVIPGMIKENALDICVAVDTSGSISEKILTEMLTEIKGIMEQYTDYQIRIWSFDTEVHQEMIYRSDECGDITEYEAKGGGGTLYECNFSYMKENDIHPKILMIFTDMCPCNGWGDSDYCDHVIFVNYANTEVVAPYGTTISIN
jgi:predicted metal-dependent peptidase